MPDIAIQFHALPEELVPLVKESVVSLKLYLLGFVYPPWSVRPIATEEIEDAIVQGPFWRIALSKTVPKLVNVTQQNFSDLNPGLLYVDIGRKTREGLKESSLACRTLEHPIPSEWKQIAKRLRAMTNAGVMAVNPKTGEQVFARNRRYTSKAKELGALGVPILPIAGVVRYKL